MVKLSFTPLALCKTQVLWLKHLQLLRNRAKLNTWLKTDKSGNLEKHINTFIEDWIDLYSSRCMSDPNLMALALTFLRNMVKYVKYQNLTKSCKVSER